MEISGVISKRIWKQTICMDSRKLRKERRQIWKSNEPTQTPHFIYSQPTLCMLDIANVYKVRSRQIQKISRSVKKRGIILNGRSKIQDVCREVILRTGLRVSNRLMNMIIKVNVYKSTNLIGLQRWGVVKVACLMLWSSSCIIDPADYGDWTHRSQIWKGTNNEVHYLQLRKSILC